MHAGENVDIFMGTSLIPTRGSLTLVSQYAPNTRITTKVPTMNDLCIVLNVRLSAEDSINRAAKIARWVLFEHISCK